MVMISFKSKREKAHLLDKARKMEEYASMIVECIEESETDERDSYRRRYREEEDEEPMDEMMSKRYGYRRGMR